MESREKMLILKELKINLDKEFTQLEFNIEKTLSNRKAPHKKENQRITQNMIAHEYRKTNQEWSKLK